GLGTENIARKFGITREQADEFSLNSHKKALAAIATGNFKDETIPVEVKITSVPNGNGASSESKSAPVKLMTQTFVFSTDAGPVAAIPKALKLAGLSLNDIAVIELNEAFAAQSLAVIRQAGLDPAKVNPNGGAIALGHPLGCTGAKLTATIIRELQRRNAHYGMVTMCIGGGMGAAGILERLA